MNRRRFLTLVLNALPLAATVRAGARPTPPAPVRLQESPVAGFQFHRGGAAWPRLRVGAPLRLVREPRNPHDPRAVAVYSGAAQLGYVPRNENTAVAALLDQGVRLTARVTRLRVCPDPWERVRFEVEMPT